MMSVACGGDSGEPASGPPGGVGTPPPAAGTLGTPPAAGSPSGAAGATSTSSGAAGRTAPPTSGVAGSPAGGQAGTLAAAAGSGAAGTSAAAGSGSAGTGPSGAAGDTVSAAGSGAAGSSGGVAGAGQPPATGAGGFPKTDEVNVKSKGPYAVMTYTDGLSEPAYDSAMMYYPADAEPPFAAVAFTPGFTATKEDYTFLGDMLASHGIAALLTTPTTLSDQPPARGEDLQAAVKAIQAENTREGSPLKGKLATDRICITGHSMGGGGTLFAANDLGDMVRCAMPLQPWQPGGTFRDITTPTMFIGAQADTIASVSGNSQPHYASIPDSTEKILVVFEGDHFLTTNRTSTSPSEPKEATPSFDIQAAYIIPFYKLHLEDDERYRPFLYGDMRSMDGVTDFQSSK
ncbi:MAG: hypothetical protein ABW321_08165 [Polyangiales bacterium]